MTEAEMMKAVKDAVIDAISDPLTQGLPTEIRAAQAALVLRERGLLKTVGPYTLTIPDLTKASEEYWRGARDAEEWILGMLGISTVTP